MKPSEKRNASLGTRISFLPQNLDSRPKLRGYNKPPPFWFRTRVPATWARAPGGRKWGELLSARSPSESVLGPSSGGPKRFVFTLVPSPSPGGEGPGPGYPARDGLMNYPARPRHD